MRKFGYLLFTSFLFITIYSCSKSSSPDSSGGPGPNPNPGACSGTPGSLFTAVKNVLAANCALSGCHAGSSPQTGINFGDNCTIVNQAARIKVRAVDQVGTASQMPPPPNAALSQADRQKIIDWVAAGGKLTD